MPLALAAGREIVGAVARFLVKLREVYQFTQCTNKHFAIQKYDVHEMHSNNSKLCMTWQLLETKSSSKTNKAYQA